MFLVVSFCLTFCVHGLLSAGCRIVVPLALPPGGCLPPGGEVGPGLQAFLWGRTDACPLMGQVGPCSSDVKVYVKECVLR